MKRYLIANNDSLAGSVEREALVITLLFMGILSFLLTSLIVYSTTFGIQPVLGKSQSAISRMTSSLPSDIKIDITSAHRVNGIAGQFIKIDGIITNLSHNETINGGIAYISIVDIKNKIPIDLEDWSAEKGLLYTIY
ncbi:MAG: hypothetical protein WBZ36_09200 [Candidatus Nitrosopolaris sp.]